MAWGYLKRTISALVVVCFSASVQAQAIRGEAERRRLSAPEATVSLEPSAPIANLFNRAEEGILRQDWKLTIDSLQRIIDDHEGSFMPRDNGAMPGGALYESARRHALRQIASLPPPGLHAYRVLHDGTAKGLLEKAKARHDADALRTVVDRYLLTRYGDDAAELLASWALDESRPREALRALADVTEFVADSDVPPELISAKVAVAHVMMESESAADQVARALDHYPGLAAEPPTWWWVLDDPEFHQRQKPPRSPVPEPVQPFLAGKTPWRYEFGGLGDGSASRLTRPTSACRNTFESGRWPKSVLAYDPPKTGGTTSSGTRFYARTARGCVALNADDLSELWQWPAADSDAEAQMRAAARTGGTEALSSTDPSSASAIDVISVGHGLVLTVVVDESKAPTKTNPAQVQVAVAPGRPQPSPVPVITSIPTRLAACDTESGVLKWSSPVADELDPPGDFVELRGPALEVGTNLWIPGVQRQELFVGVVDPKDGKLAQRIALCPVESSRQPARNALLAAQVEETVYVPTNQGFLFAIDAESESPRWAARYKFEGGRTANHWLPAAPVVVGGLVLLAAADCPSLLAFSILDGSFRWSAAVPEARQLIGADGLGVYVAAKDCSVMALSLADGALAWATELPATRTGRSSLYEGVVYVPTQNGLFGLASGTGETVLEIPSDPTEAPLGNLHCTASAVYSLDGHGVRMFPDLDRAYPDTLARFQRTAPRHNPDLGIRLAWMELLRSNPQRALDVLDLLPAARAKVPGDVPRNQSRVRVEALLSQAGQSGTAGSQSLELIAEANRLATTVSDRIRCGRALAEQLTSLGRYAESFRALWRLGTGADGGQMISDCDTVATMARFAVAKALRLVSALLSERDRAQLHADLMQEIDSDCAALLVPRNGLREGKNATEVQRRLRAAADLAPFGDVSQRALLALAEWEIRVPRYEQAEHLLLESRRVAQENPATADASLTATTLMRLCELYLTPALGMNQMAERYLAELEQAFGACAIASDFSLEGNSTARVISEWIPQLRSRIANGGGETVQRPAGSETTAAFTFLPEPGFSYKEAGRRIVRFGDSVPAALATRVVLYGSKDTLSAIDPRDGKLVWSSALRLPEQFEEDDGVILPTASERPRQAVLDGQIGVFNGSDGLFGVGLVTGKRLWAVPYEPPPASYEFPRSDDAMAAADAWLAAMPRRGRLALMRTADGRLIWERDLCGEPVEHLAIEGDVILAANAGWERIHLFSRKDGSLIQRMELRRFGKAEVGVLPVSVGGILCGLGPEESSNQLIGVDIQTGQTLWQVALDRPPLGRLFRFSADYLGISMLEGRLLIAKARTGEIVFDRTIAGTHLVTDGLLVDGTLLLREAGTTKQVTLQALDVATGQTLWTRKDLPTSDRWSGPLYVAGGILPTVLEGEAPKGGAVKPLELVTLDLQTGQKLPWTMSLENSQGPKVYFDLWIYPGMVVLGSNDGIRGYKTQPWTRPPRVEPGPLPERGGS